MQSYVADAADSYRDQYPAHVPVSGPVRFHSIYYDTPEGKLGDVRCSLRVRERGESKRATFKFPGQMVDGLSSREEFETDVRGRISSVKNLPPSELKQRLCEVIAEDAELVETVRVMMNRNQIMLMADGSEIELVTDEAIIYGQRGKTTLFEVELELKAGKVAPLLALGERLEAEFPLTRSTRSKHQIGLSLS